MLHVHLLQHMYLYYIFNIYVYQSFSGFEHSLFQVPNKAYDVCRYGKYTVCTYVYIVKKYKETAQRRKKHHPKPEFHCDDTPETYCQRKSFVLNISIALSPH